MRRRLDPYGLVVKNGTWYLVAASGPGRPVPRTYRVSNVLDLQPTDEAFQRLPGFDLTQFWRNQLADFDSRRITGTARLRVAPQLVARLDDIGTVQLRAAVAAGRIDESGWTLAELPIESPAWAATQLVGYGSDIEVVTPVEVRAAMRELAASVLARHH